MGFILSYQYESIRSTVRALGPLPLEHLLGNVTMTLEGSYNVLTLNYSIMHVFLIFLLSDIPGILR